MAIIFNADEIYRIAEQIERNGQKFYSQCAQRVKETDAQKVLEDLAKMEAEHLTTFQRLHAQLDEEALKELTWDPEGEATAYLRAAADSHIFKSDADPLALLPVNSGARQVLELALEFEKDSVIYFLGVADMVPQRLGKRDVQGLLKQEQGHIALIQHTLSSL